jgi:BASS family bile acid:Na+ symporter
MLRLKDFYSSVLTGVLFPRASSVFQPVPLYSMMSLLFLSFLPIKIGHIWQTIRHFSWTIFLFVIFRMLFLPTCIALLFRLIWPAYRLSALLLSGISTGVVAPFISNLLGGNSPLVLVMVVVTSLLVPFTLPPLVGLLFGQTMHISLFSMTRLLSIVIFIPILSVEVVRKVFPGLAELGALYLMAGLFISWGRTVEDQLAAVISLGIMNNVLVIVFSSEFFTPIEPTVAAMYMIPFFALIIPLRAYRGWKVGK